jgi:transposase
MEEAAGIFVGIDVSKVWLDIAVHESEMNWRAGNDGKGIAGLVKRLKQLKPTLVVLEATGVSRFSWWQSWCMQTCQWW